MLVYYDFHHPERVSADMLDDYLSKGWYRIQQTMMTTDFINYDDSFLAVFWIRFVLKNYRHSKSSLKIFDANKDFDVIFRDGAVTPEVEELYAVYKSSIDFQATDTAKDFLIGEANSNIFNTRMIEIRDKGKLIAVGFFDEGDTSIAGIMNVYHPDYKSKSLGKYLMLLKFDYAIQHKKTYYYPGYISTGTTKFDYKLFPDKEATELYLRKTNSWHPYLSLERKKLEEMLFLGGEG